MGALTETPLGRFPLVVFRFDVPGYAQMPSVALLMDDHAMYHHGPGVMRHARLGIWVIVLDEIDPQRNGRKMIQALGDLGIAREKLAKVERERDLLLNAGIARRNPDGTIDIASIDQLDRLRAELGAVRAENERLRGLLAAADEFGDRHVIDLREDGWTIAHPLSCRARGLFACPLNTAATDLGWPPEVGRFAVTAEDGGLVLGERTAETVLAAIPEEVRP